MTAVSFQAGSRLWLLLGVAALAAVYVVQQMRRKHYAVRFTNLALLDRIAPRRPAWRRHVPAIAFLLALGTFTTAFAMPSRPVKVPRERATVIMAIDTSLSMEATDIEPTRIEAAKEAAASFVDLLPGRLNLGLVSFSGTAQVLVAPTTDHSLVKRSITTLELGPRTAIGEAVFLSLQSINTVPSEPGQAKPPARIVLMSDGETTVGRPNEMAAQAAAEARVPVYTIAFGTDDGTVAVEGRLVPVPVNRDALRQLAEATGGTAFDAASAKELRQVYNDIGSSIGYRTVPREVTSWFVGLGLLFALAAAGGSLLWSSRLP
ncbi:MAG: VWA domain-containing protein [Acidimicrobiales bacterium]